MEEIDNYEIPSSNRKPIIFDTESALETKICSFCGSVFILDTHCESCGVRFNVDLLGQPLDYRSFYFQKDQYWSQKSLFIRIFPKYERKKAKKAKRYQSFLFQRYRLLLRFFISTPADHSDSRKQYWLELRDLIQELLFYGSEKRMFFIELDSLSGLQGLPKEDLENRIKIFYQILSSELAKNAPPQKVHFIDKLFFNRYFGVRPIGFITTVLFCLAACIYLISYARYLMNGY
jgi:hypothetical protein